MTTGIAYVTWLATPEPWRLEERLIARLDLPLNLEHNEGHPCRATLSAIRSAAKVEADRLPIVP